MGTDWNQKTLYTIKVTNNSGFAQALHEKGKPCAKPRPVMLSEQ